MVFKLFAALLWKNERRYNRLVVEPTMNNDSTIQYTLSIRFQLNENIRSMKLLQTMVFFCTVSNFFCFLLVAGVHIDWMHLGSDVIAHYLDAILNLYIVIYAALIPIIGRFFDEQKILPERTTAEEGHIYFVNLQKQWNATGPAKKSKRK
ncbi:hypothetical protein COOONC_05727 [Cooperia oncophora]